MATARRADSSYNARRPAAPLGSTPPRKPQAKRVLDIEDVLRWAYRDELPKAIRSGPGLRADLARLAYPSASPMFAMVAVGVPVDTFAREPGFPVAVGGPHPDALIVRNAVETLIRMDDHTFEGEPGLAPDMSGFGIDERAVLATAAGVMGHLIVKCAKLGSRPSLPDLPECGAVQTSNGKPRVLAPRLVADEYLGGRTGTRKMLAPVTAMRGNTYEAGAHCPVVWEPSPQAVVRDRAEYAVWWAALDFLARELRGKLSSISVLSPSAPQRPWAGDRELGKPGPVAARRRASAQEQAAAERSLGGRRQAPRRTSAARVAIALSDRLQAKRAAVPA